MIQIFRTIALIAMGLLFAFSGFVKAIDPMGGAIQFTDYFNALNLTFLIPFSLPLSVLLSAIEFLIGVHLLFALRVKVLAWPALVMMLFFTLLTLYIAIFNPVSDCGCFGEAVTLTNWQTFYKNLVFLPLVLIIFWQRKKVICEVAPWRQWTMSVLFTALVLTVAYIGINSEPILDFRPFKVGTHIPTAMSIPEGAEQPEYDTRFVLEKDGVRQEFGVNDYPYTDTTWVFIESKTAMLKEGYQPPIKHFSLHSLAGIDMTAELLNADTPVFLLIAPRIEEMDQSNLKLLTDLHILSVEKGFAFYCVTSSLQQQIQEFDMKLQVGFDYLIGDETELKTISRHNPGLVLLYKGTVAGKWHAAELQTTSVFNEPLSAAFGHLHHKNGVLAVVLSLMCLLSIVFLFYRK
jgi:hypothetical protein